jgi:hypothetical protein
MNNEAYLSNLTPQERAEGVLADFALFTVEAAFENGNCKLPAGVCQFFSPTRCCEDCRLTKLAQAHKEYAKENEL